MALLALVGVVAGLSIPASGYVLWRLGSWAAFAVVCALALFAPQARSSANLSEQRAWQVAAAGAAGLAFFWLVFALPRIDTNTAFVLTLATAAAAGAAWLAPGRVNSS